MSGLGAGIREKAVIETRKKTCADNILNLMKSYKSSAEEIMSAMAVPEEDRQELLDMVNERMAANA